MAIRPTPKRQNFVCLSSTTTLSCVPAFVFTALCGVAWCVFNWCGVFLFSRFIFQPVQSRTSPANKKPKQVHVLCAFVSCAQTQQHPKTACKQFRQNKPPIAIANKFKAQQQSPRFRLCLAFSFPFVRFVLKNDLRFSIRCTRMC